MPCLYEHSCIRRQYDILLATRREMLAMNQFAITIFCAVFVFPASCESDTGISQETREYWKNLAENKLSSRQARLLSIANRNKAKNAIIFIGDGMGPTVVTAARIYRGQSEQRENNQEPLLWEQFSYAGLVRTHSLNQHVTDSAASATAMFTGTKVNSRTLGVDGNVQINDCSAVNNRKLESIASMAIKKGMSVGLVTTTPVTDATPAALYAHSAQRAVQSDFDGQLYNLSDCVDIAKQLIDHFPGNQFKVILGGGRRKMLPNGAEDLEDSRRLGERLDGRNLIEDWKKGEGRRAFVSRRDQLLDIDYDQTDFLMGLFAFERFPYELQSQMRNDTTHPTLSEMTEAAINILQKNPNGFLLLVEGGIIDIALHNNSAKFAVTETLAMEKAVETARTMTSKDETLVIVTADHSHALSLPGYMDRNISIFAAQVPTSNGVDDLPNTALVFANGPSALRHSNKTATITRWNLSTVDTEDPYFQQPAFIPLTTETHGGEEVGLWADGPFDHLFTGTMDNTYIAHAIACAMCLNENICKFCKETFEDSEDEDFFEAFEDWLEKFGLMLTVFFSAGSFIILVILLVLRLSHVREKSWNVA